MYHVTSRGDRREDIYLDDADRALWLDLLADTCRRFDWAVQAYCLMSNHYHLLVQTPDANLAAGMRHLNGVYTQRVNQRQRRMGHVFQGRYQAVLVDREAHLLELARYEHTSGSGLELMRDEQAPSPQVRSGEPTAAAATALTSRCVPPSIKGMRTTLTLDDDVATKLTAEARRAGLPFKQVVNETLRRGLVAQRASAVRRPSFKVHARDLGEVKPGVGLDNIGELLEQIEGPRHR